MEKTIPHCQRRDSTQITITIQYKNNAKQRKTKNESYKHPKTEYDQRCFHTARLTVKFDDLITVSKSSYCLPLLHAQSLTMGTTHHFTRSGGFGPFQCFTPPLFIELYVPNHDHVFVCIDFTSVSMYFNWIFYLFCWCGIFCYSF